jgi:hypothetical protein
MFHLTIDMLFQISIASHPRVGARNPQKKGASDSSLNSISHNPLVFPYKYPKFSPDLFLLTCPTQGMNPFSSLSPPGVPFVYQGLFGSSTRNLFVGNSRDLTTRKTTNNEQQTLAVTVQLTHKFTLQAWQPGSSISSSKTLQHAPEFVQPSCSSSDALFPSCSCQKNSMCKSLNPSIRISSIF